MYSKETPAELPRDQLTGKFKSKKDIVLQGANQAGWRANVTPEFFQLSIGLRAPQLCRQVHRSFHDQQTNRAFANPGSSWYFNRNSSQNAGKPQDRDQLLDTEYRDSAKGICLRK